MSEVVIRAENVGKKYIISHQPTGGRFRYVALRDVLAGSLRNFGKRIVHPFRGHDGNATAETREELWALKKVSFEVHQGDRIGIIGRNGAGKSTLLKILSRITDPTTGRITIRGRVSSLLEVGTGFHPELTGRENIYLNGAILGMRKREIRTKFDEIVAFAEIEKFLDTPVKRYSSGMYVRLAFSVAAHLEPEILIVDEVLAVGDAEFQKKCLGKMKSISDTGRTLLFVSHNMGVIQTLCRDAGLLQSGELISFGPADEVVSLYLRAKHELESSNPFLHCSRSGDGTVRISSFHLETVSGDKTNVMQSGSSIVFVIGLCSRKKLKGRLSVGFSVHDENEVGLLNYYSHHSNTYFREICEDGFVRCKLQDVPLAPGTYYVGFRVVCDDEEADWPQVLVPIQVMAGDFYGTGHAHTATWGSGFLVKGTWEYVRKVESKHA